MITVTIKVKQNSKASKAFFEISKKNPFVEVLNTSDTSLNKKETLLFDIEKGLQEVKSIREGKTKPLSTSDLWNE